MKIINTTESSLAFRHVDVALTAGVIGVGACLGGIPMAIAQFGLYSLGKKLLQLDDKPIVVLSKTPPPSSEPSTSSPVFRHVDAALAAGVIGVGAWLGGIPLAIAQFGAYSFGRKLLQLDDKPTVVVSKTPPPSKTAPQNLALTSSDHLLTASNLVRWGLIGASLYGAPMALVGALSAITTLGSEIASYSMLSEDTSFSQRVMAFPFLARAVMGSSPLIANISQGASLWSVIKNSTSKIYEACRHFGSDPKNAGITGALHLFNLVSSVAFASDLAKPKSPKLCAPRALVNLPCNGCGMFSVEHYLVGVLDRFERGGYSGIKVDFEKNGLYYDPSKGPNWFEYYFPPIDIVDKNCIDAPQESFNQHEYGDLASYTESAYAYENNGLPPARAKELILKYLSFKPEIQQEVNEFAKTHFSESDYVVGVHYRGTDKTCDSSACEARKVSYDEMTSQITSHIGQLELGDQSRVKIFAASDEQGFIDHLEKQYPGKLVSSPSRKSTDGKPLHFNAKDPYKTGKEALIDYQLLGTLSNVLIRTSSNLSKFAALILREGAKVIEVSKRFYQDPTVRTSTYTAPTPKK